MTTFEAAYHDDDNHWWYSQSGDCQNAYDAALEELDGLRAAVARVRARCDVREQGNPMHEPGRHEVPTWILVADVRNALAGPTTG